VSVSVIADLLAASVLGGEERRTGQRVGLWRSRSRTCAVDDIGLS
jgi:hypothetical protein